MKQLAFILSTLVILLAGCGVKTQDTQADQVEMQPLGFIAMEGSVGSERFSSDVKVKEKVTPQEDSNKTTNTAKKATKRWNQSRFLRM